MNRFENRVVLVTGGSRNTGLEIVDLLSDEARAFQGAILKMDSGATVALYPPYAEDSVPLPAEWKGAEAFSGAASMEVSR